MTRGTSVETERARILQGFIETVGEAGYGAASLESILDRAGLDEAAFRRHFADREDCFLAAWDTITARCRPLALEAFAHEDTWLEQMRAVGEAIHGYLLDNPNHGRIIYVDGTLVGARARARLQETIDVFTELIDLGRQELDDPDSLSRATAEGLAGAVYEQVSRHLVRGDVDELSGLIPQLMYTVVRPYLGLAAATRELHRSR